MRSIWTVDLAHLLRSFGLAVEFLTVTLGANPAYACEHFYREHLREDCARVKRLFQALPGACTLASEWGCFLFEHEPIHVAYLREGCARVTRLFQADAAQGLHLGQRVRVSFWLTASRVTKHTCARTVRTSGAFLGAAQGLQRLQRPYGVLSPPMQGPGCSVTER